MSDMNDFLRGFCSPEAYEQFKANEERRRNDRILKARASMLTLLDDLKETISEWLRSEGLLLIDSDIQEKMSECEYLIYDEDINYSRCGLNGKECEVSNCGNYTINNILDNNEFYQEAIFNAKWAAVEELLKVLPHEYLIEIEENKALAECDNA